MIKESRFVLQQKIVTLVELVDFGQTEILPQQIGHRAVFKPVPMQTPLAAGSDQTVGAERLKNQIPACAFAAGGQTLFPELIQTQFRVELAEQPTCAPLAGAAQFQFRELDPNDVGVISW